MLMVEGIATSETYWHSERKDGDNAKWKDCGAVGKPVRQRAEQAGPIRRQMEATIENLPRRRRCHGTTMEQ